MMRPEENSDRRLSATWQKIVRWGLLSSIFLLPFVKTVDLPIVGPKLTIVEIVLLPITALWLAGMVRGLRFHAPRFTVDYLLVGFLLAACASGWTVLHERPTATFLVQFGFEVFTFVYLILFFAMARGFLGEPGLFNASLSIWLLAAGVVGLLGLIGIGEMFLCHRPLSGLVFKYSRRLISTFRDPNQAALYVVPTILFFGALWLSGEGLARWRRWLPVVLLMAVMALYFTGSRGGWIGCVVGMIPLLWAGWRQRCTWASLGVVVLLVLALWASVSLAAAGGNYCMGYLAKATHAMTVDLPSVMDTLSDQAAKWLGVKSLGEKDSITADESQREGESIATDQSLGEGESIATDEGLGERETVASDERLGERDSIDLEPTDAPRGPHDKTISEGLLRLIMADYAFQIVKEHPVIGIGSGTMHLYMDELTGHEVSIVAHNTFLTLWAETGTMGMLFFAATILLSLLAGLKNCRQADTPFERAVSLGLFSALLGLLVIGLVHDAQRQRLLWLLMAMIFAQKERLKSLAADPAVMELQAVAPNLVNGEGI